MGQDPDRERREDSEIAALRLTYEELQRENLRLRDARASLTSQLGPLPISAALVAGLVSGFSVSGASRLNEPLTIIALCVFAAMVVVSVCYSKLAPYRELRDEMKPERGELIAHRAGAGRDAEREWYSKMIKLERSVRGNQDVPQGQKPRTTLTDAYNAEWWGVAITKCLFVVVVVLLILARIV